MLHVVCEQNRKANSSILFSAIKERIASSMEGNVVVVPEQFSFEAERLLLLSCGNKVSRYAEVVSFSRLCERVNSCCGGSAVRMMDDAGCFLALSLAVSRCSSRLKVFASALHSSETVSILLRQIREFKTCGITSKQLHAAAALLSGRLSQKLSELSMLLESYDEICAGGNADPEDKLSILADQLWESDYAEQHTFFFDGFSDFTAVQYEIIRVLLRKRTDVTVFLVLDRMNSDCIAFQPASEALRRLKAISSEERAEVTVSFRMDENRAFPLPAFLEADVSDSAHPSVEVVRCDSAETECGAIISAINDVLRKGARCRDISVVYSGASDYASYFRTLCEETGLPYSMNETPNLSDEPAIIGLIYAMKAVVNGFSIKNVFGWLNSPIGILPDRDRDRLSLYCRAWNVRGAMWEKPFYGNPDGFGAEMTESSQKKLEEMNLLRIKAITPLLALKKCLSESDTYADLAEGLFRFLTDTKAEDRLLSRAERLSPGDRRVLELNRVFSVLTDCLAQITLVLGKVSCTASYFIDVISELFRRSPLKSVPASQDALSFGPASSFRYKVTPYLFAAGCEEGFFPAASDLYGVFTEAERNKLLTGILPVSGGAWDRLGREYGTLYDVLSGCEIAARFTYKGERCAALLKDICSVTDANIRANSQADTIFTKSRLSAAITSGLLPCDFGDDEIVRLKEEYRTRLSYQPGNLSPEFVLAQWPEELQLSSSQMNSYLECPFSWFMRYVMKVRPLSAGEYDAAAFGNMTHSVLERLFRDIYGADSSKLPDQETFRQLTDRYLGEYKETSIPAEELKDDRFFFLFSRSVSEIQTVAEQAYLELSASDFRPKRFEYPFSENDFLATVNNRDIRIQIDGKIDRVDECKLNGADYFRVLDYKTGNPSMSFERMYFGLDLQLFLYLNVYSRQGGKIAGALLFPASEKQVNVKKGYDPNEAASCINDKRKETGILLNDPSVIHAMEHFSDKPTFLPITCDKAGNYSGSIVSETDFSNLMKHTSAKIVETGEQILSGNIEIRPFKSNGKLRCTYCEYRHICRKNPDDVSEQKTMKGEEFWTLLRERYHE